MLMCGITGWLLQTGTELPLAVLDHLSESLRHRGPDDAGQYRDPAGLALANRRLNIIDLSPGGHPPMIYPDTGDVLVFNGEIYNFRELRAELEHQGCRFCSSSDTEVLLQGLAVWGLWPCLEVAGFRLRIAGNGPAV